MIIYSHSIFYFHITMNLIQIFDRDIISASECETVVAYRYGHTIKEIKGYKKIPITETADILSWKYTQTRANHVVVKDSKKSDWIYIVMTVCLVLVTSYLTISKLKHIDFILSLNKRR